MLAFDPARVKAWHSSCQYFRAPSQQEPLPRLQPEANHVDGDRHQQQRDDL